jgi:DNA-binding beta-propeller fold protein YncE
MKRIYCSRQWLVSLAALLALSAVSGTLGAQEPSAERLLVLLRDASELAIVDPASGTVLGRVPTGRDPHEVTASPDGRLAFVASPSDGISVIDLVTQSEIRRVDPGPGSGPHDVLFLDGKVYFTIEGYKSIGRYDPETDQIDWTLGIGQESTHMFALGSDRRTLFMANRGSNSITMAEGISGGPSETTLSVIPVPGDRPEGIDVSPDGRELWTATRNDGSVSIIDVATKAAVQNLDLGMQDANRLKFTRDGRVLILDGAAASLVVLDAASRSVIERIRLAQMDTGDGAVLVSRDGRRAYIGLRDADRVAVLDLATLEVTDEIMMGEGSGPGCMFWARANN